MANKRTITRLVFDDAQLLAGISLGEDFAGRTVKSISFRKDTHTTTGSSGCPCYVVAFVNDTVQAVIPRESVKYVLTDKTEAVAEEDGSPVPELPDGEEE